MFAALSAVREYAESLGDSHVFLQTGNKTTIAYICKEGGTHSIGLLSLTFRIVSNISTAGNIRQLEYNPVCTVPAGQVQCHSGPTVGETTGTRMAPVTHSHLGGVQALGSARHGPLCVKVGYSTRVRYLRFTRLSRRVRRRVFTRLELPARLDIPTSKPTIEDTLARKQGKGHLPCGGSRLGAMLLESGSPNAGTRRADESDQLTQNVGGSHDRAPASSDRPIGSDGLESWGWGDKLASWSQAEKDLLIQSWRKSTLETYQPAIRRWIVWCVIKKS